MIFDFISWLGDFVYYGMIKLFVPAGTRYSWIAKYKSLKGQEWLTYSKTFKGRCASQW